MDRYLQKQQKIDAIVLSHATLKYCGGLPYVLASLGVSCPVLATVPVHHLGLVTLYDAYQSFQLTTGQVPSHCTLDDIDRAFEHITLLRYAQPFTLDSASIIISAIPAGHTAGGAIWRFKKGDETVVYSPAFNHKRESHLDGSPFELIQKPTLLITSASQALQAPQIRKNRDEALFSHLNTTLKANGNVLIPIDTAARCLEVIQLLEHQWNSSKRKESLIFLTNQSKRTIELAKGMLEWMGQSMMKAFEGDRANPFELRNIKLCHSMADIHALPEPRVVLASFEDLEVGFARSVFISIASQTKSLVLFLTSPSPGTLGSTLLTETAKNPKITVKIVEKVPLTAEELKAFYRAQEEEKERIAAEAAFEELKRRREAEEVLEFSSDEDESSVQISDNKLDHVTELDKINSAKALREIYWTDYKTDWNCKDDDLESLAMNLDYPLKETDGLNERHQSFPFQYVRERTSDYGTVVDLKSLEKEEATEKASELQPDMKFRRVEEEKKEIPTKIIDYSKEVTVRCQRQYIDFSGLTDGRSLKTIINQIDPKRLILIGGPSDPTDLLLNHFLFVKSNQEGFECRAPNVNETIRITVASNTLQAFLSQSILDQMKMTAFKDLELSYLHARMAIRRENVDVEGVVDKMDIDEVAPPIEPSEEDFTLVIEAPESGLYSKRRRPLMVGDVRLNELRTLISGKLGLPADFVAGDLVIGDGRLRLRKDEEKLLLEGPTTEAFYGVRDLLYNQLAIM